MLTKQKLKQRTRQRDMVVANGAIGQLSWFLNASRAHVRTVGAGEWIATVLPATVFPVDPVHRRTEAVPSRLKAKSIGVGRWGWLWNPHRISAQGEGGRGVQFLGGSAPVQDRSGGNIRDCRAGPEAGWVMDEWRPGGCDLQCLRQDGVSGSGCGGGEVGVERGNSEGLRSGRRSRLAFSTAGPGPNAFIGADAAASRRLTWGIARMWGGDAKGSERRPSALFSSAFFVSCSNAVVQPGTASSTGRGPLILSEYT
ncbi:unnamed protein product [Calypogeia fissa]